MKKYFIFIILSIMIFSCTSQKKNTSNVVTVSVLPQKYFVEQIAGNDFQINVMIPPGGSPATYEPAPNQIKALSESPIYFRIGYIPFEKAWMSKFLSINKSMKVVDTSKGVDLLLGEHHHHDEVENEHHTEGQDHNHGEVENEHHAEEQHHHEKGVDPHIWLSPKAVKIQAKNIYDALVMLQPDKADIYKENLDKFMAKLDILDKDIKDKLQLIDLKVLLVFHPTWGYFARDYGLEQISIEKEGKEPTPANLKEVINLAKEKDIKVIFVQKQFNMSYAEAIAKEINARVITLDPLAENWYQNMYDMLDILSENLK